MLHLIRGLPGSGKSTFAKTLGCLVLEADMFFVRNSIYTFNGKMIAQAHMWCLNTTAIAIKAGMDVAVSNTFSTMWELEKYLAIDTCIKVYRCMGKWQSVHGIPAEAYQKMANRFEDFAGETFINR